MKAKKIRVFNHVTEIEKSFISMTEASKYTKISLSTISKVISRGGTFRPYKKFSFKLESDKTKFRSGGIEVYNAINKRTTIFMFLYEAIFFIGLNYIPKSASKNLETGFTYDRYCIRYNRGIKKGKRLDWNNKLFKIKGG